MTATPDLDEAIGFLNHAYPTGPWCLTAIFPDKGQSPTETVTFRTGEHEAALKWIADHHDRRMNTYFSVNRSANWTRAAFIAYALGSAYQSGGWWTAPRPVPPQGNGMGDRNSSLSLRDKPRRGQVLVHCFASLSGTHIISASSAPIE